MAFLATLMVSKALDKRKEEELLRAFELADINKDGFLSKEEYIRVFTDHGIEITEEEVNLYFSQKDKDMDGRISYDEFTGKKTMTELAFKAMDLNSDGFLSKPEMLTAGRRLSAREVDLAFEQFDKDGDCKLNYEEFCAMMNRRKSADHREDERNGDGPRGSIPCLLAFSTQKSKSGEWEPKTEYGDPRRKYKVAD